MAKLELCEPNLVESTLESLLQSTSFSTSASTVQEDINREPVQEIGNDKLEVRCVSVDGALYVQLMAEADEVLLCEQSADKEVQVMEGSDEVFVIEKADNVSVTEKLDDVPLNAQTASVDGQSGCVSMSESHLAYVKVSEEISDLVERESELHVDSLQGTLCLSEEIMNQTALIKEITEEKRQIKERLLESEREKSDLQAQVELLRKHNSTLVCTVSNLVLHEDSLGNDDAKVAYYTGLPTCVPLMHIFVLVSPKIPDSPLYVLSKFQQFLMVLMGLRLNPQVQDLAYRFNVSAAKVSRIFYK